MPSKKPKSPFVWDGAVKENEAATANIYAPMPPTNPPTPLAGCASEESAYLRHAMRVACFTCGAGIGEPCTTTLAEVPDTAARVHINRVIAADHTFANEVPNGR